MTTPTASPPDSKKPDYNKPATEFFQDHRTEPAGTTGIPQRQESGDQLPIMDPAIISKSFQELFDKLLKNLNN